MTAIPPPDDMAHRDNLLMAEVTSVNTQLGRYVLRFLDADAGRAEALSVDDERVLGYRLAALAAGVSARAAHRDQHGESPRLFSPASPAATDG